MEQVDVAVIGGGQSGLAAAGALRRQGLAPVVLEASERAVGSWPHYYDSLRLFSPAQYSSLPGLPFGGDENRYPRRDEVIAYLERYAQRLGVEIRTGRRVVGVSAEDGGFVLALSDGASLTARAVIAATGGFGNPYRPDLPGLDSFAGTVLHAGEYRRPDVLAEARVVVVGAGNSAVQIAAELAGVARVTLASRKPVRFARRITFGRDLHFWLAATGLDDAPLGRFLKDPPTQLVIDDGRYRRAIAEGVPDRRPVFDRIDGPTVTWTDGSHEAVDAVILATGYRPDLQFLAPLRALDERGHPLHRGGLSTVHPLLGYVGLEWQRGLSSASLRGVGRDADRIARAVRQRLAFAH